MGKAEKTEKTNACRLLDRAGIPYRLIPYPVDPDHLDAHHVADALGEDIARVFKTLVLCGDRNGHFVCVIPGAEEVDLKKAAKVSGNKKADLIPMKELLPLTGYIRGGCTAIGMKKRFPCFIHETATAFDAFFVSAGQRGLQLELSPRQFIDYTGATVADITKNDSEDE